MSLSAPTTPPPAPYSPHVFFFFNDTATTEIYTLSLHDALPISLVQSPEVGPAAGAEVGHFLELGQPDGGLHVGRSEEHTSELQSPCNLVCRLLLEKKNEVTTDGRSALLFSVPPSVPDATIFPLG